MIVRIENDKGVSEMIRAEGKLPSTADQEAVLSSCDGSVQSSGVEHQISQTPQMNPATEPGRESLTYWLAIPRNWGWQMFRNGSDILRVLDILKLRPLPAGLVDLDHPWVTGISPQTGQPIWPANLIYHSPPKSHLNKVDDNTILTTNGRFLALRVGQSAIVPERPIGPERRMPHCINYMHGSSHYNSGVILLNDITEAYQHVNDPNFRLELRRFVKQERREVLFMLRDREYSAREYAYLSCCMRTHFHWFCNPNGPGERVLWGNYAPFPVANLITGHWSDDVYALKRPEGAASVARPPIETRQYFQNRPYNRGRDHALWAEKLLAWVNYYRVKLRGKKGGMFFIDRRKVYSDQIARRESQGLPDESRARFEDW